MKIKTFNLDKFGHFSDQSFDFSKGEGIQILYGPNEAGKSTVLHALRDVLFGIDPRSPYNFIHDYRDMRLSATIENALGLELEFQRRKGNKNTLLSVSDEILPDGALMPFLGAVDKDQFTRMFGLDHAELREGGQALIDAEGDAADSLFGRAAGLTSILSVAKELKERADTLFSARKSKEKPFYRALDRRTTAIGALKENIVKTSEWDGLLAEIERETLHKQELEEKLGLLRSKEAQANRSIRVRPIINRIRTLRKQLEDLGEVPTLNEETIERRKNSFQARNEANKELTRLDNRINDFKGRIDDLEISEEFLANGAAIEKLFEQGGAILKGREDIPKLETGIEQARKNIESCLARLDLTIDLAHAKEALPPDGVLSKIRNLVSEEGKKSGLVGQNRQLVNRSIRAIQDVEEELVGLPETKDPARLILAVKLAQRKVNLGIEIKKAEKNNSEALQHLNEINAALPNWQGSVEELISLKAPLAETVESFAGHLVDFKQEIDPVETEVLRQQAEIKSIESELEAIASGEEVPTPQAILALRSRRDDGWKMIRRRYIDADDTITDAELISFAEETPISDAYEIIVKDADSLVDRKEAEAARIAKLQELTRRKREDESTLSDLLERQQELELSLGKKMADWHEVWKPSGVEPLSPKEMLEWVKERANILNIYKNNRETVSEIAIRKEEYEAAKSSLVQALTNSGHTDVSEDVDFEFLLEQAEEQIEFLERSKADRDAKIRDRKHYKNDLTDHEQALAEASTDLDAWKSEWDVALKALGQPNTHRPQDIEPVLNLYEELRGNLIEQDRLYSRLSGIKRDETAYREQITKLVGDFSPDQIDVDPVAANKVLNERLKAMRLAADQMQSHQKELELTNEEKSIEIAQHAEAAEVIEALKEEVGSETDEDLIFEHEQWIKSLEITTSLNGQLAQLDEAGDGYAFEVLVEDVDMSSLEEDQTNKDIAETELSTIHQLFTDVGASLNDLERQRSEMEKGRGAEHSAQEKEQAIAEIRDVSETYMLQTAAHLMLQAAVDRVRKARQGPIVAAAGKLFSKLTQNSFVGLAVDFDDNDRAILRGERADGQRVGVEGMSEGARDQMFLALRLALVREYIVDNEPMPFIADDLLLSFDNERAAVALTVLLDIAKETQVLFFTHHPHLVDLAESVIGKSNFVVHEFS